MKIKNWIVLAGTLVLAYAGAAFAGTNVWTETGPLAADVKVKFSSSATSPMRAAPTASGKVPTAVRTGPRWRHAMPAITPSRWIPRIRTS